MSTDLESARSLLTEVQAYLKIGGVLTARESDLANSLSSVLRAAPEDMEDLLDTRAGLALAHTAWSEGAGSMLQAVNEHESGPWVKPENPYSAPLLSAIREDAALEASRSVLGGGE